MSNRFISLVLLASIMATSGCVKDRSSSGFDVDCNCSLVELIANPRGFQNHKVRVMGYAALADEQPGVARLYLTRDDARIVNDASSVWVDFREVGSEKLDLISEQYGRFVVVEGVFRSRDNMLVIEEIADIRVFPPYNKIDN